MNRSAIIAGFIALGGAAAGVLLVPGGFELAEMQFRDENYHQALVAFSARWEQGDKSREVAVRLSDLYLRESDLERAAAILLDYSARAPEDAEVQLRLVQLFLDSQRLDDSIGVLSRLVLTQPTPVLLRRLAALQDFAGRTQDRTMTLARLIETGAATPDEHLETASALATSGDTTRALTVLYNAARRFPERVDEGFLFFFLALAVDCRRVDLAAALGQVYWARARDAASFESVVSQFVRLGQTKAALSFARIIAPQSPGDARTMVIAAGLESLYGDAGMAMRMLRSLRDGNNLPTEGATLLIDLALRSGATEEAFGVAESMSFPALPRWVKSNLATHAMVLGNRAFARTALAQYTPDGIAGEPALVGRLALADGDRAAASARAEESARLAAPLPVERLDLAQLFSDLGERTRAENALAPLYAELDTMAEDELQPLIVAAATLGQKELAVAAAERYAALKPGSRAKVLLARAYAISGRGREALELLVGLDLTEDYTEDAYVAALRSLGERTTLQTHLYRRLLQSLLTPERQLTLLYTLRESGPPFVAGAQAVADFLDRELKGELSPQQREVRLSLVAIIDPVRALPWLHAAAQANPGRDGPPYVEALRKLGRHDALVAFVSTVLPQMPDGPISDGFIYVLIEIKADAAALPALEARARSRGGDWEAAYLDALKRTGGREALVAYASAIASEPGTNDTRRRSLAFALLEAGARDDAEVIFRGVAERSGPSSPDTQQLLFIWGPRPASDRIAWLIGQARRGPATTRAGWLEHAVNLGGAGDAGALARELLQGGYDSLLARILAKALSAQRDRAGFDFVAPLVLQNENDARTILAIAREAEGAGAASASLALYRAAAEKGEVAGFEGAAQSALAMGLAKDALVLLESFTRAGGNSFTSDFLRAEALYALNRKGDAQVWYGRALDGAAKAAADNRIAMRISALALIRLGRISQAQPAIMQILAANPGDRGLRAEIAAALIDAGALALASQVIDGQR